MSAGTIGEAFIAIRPSLAGFSQEVDEKVNAAGHGAIKIPVAVDANSARSAGESAGHNSGAGFSNTFKAAALIGVAAVSAGLLKFGSDAVGAFKTVATQAVQTQRVIGGTVEDASRLNFAFGETGVNATAATASLGRFEKGLVSSAGTTKGQAGELTKLGVSYKDAQGHMLPMADLLPKLADKFKDMPNGPEKTAAAMTLFGKTGATMLPFLNRGAEGIAELEKESDKYGDTINSKGVASLKAYNEAHKQVAAATEGLKISVGEHLMPIIANLEKFLAEKVVPIFEKVADFIERNSKVLVPLITIIGSLVAAFKIFTVVMAAWDAVMDADPVVLIATALIALGVAIYEAYTHCKTFRDIIEDIWKAIQTAVHVVVQAGKDIVGVFSTVISWITQHWRLVLTILTGPFGLAISIITKYWKQITDGIADVIDWIKSHWKLLLAILTGPIGVAVLLITKYWHDITKIFTDLWHDVVKLWNSLWKDVENALTTAWNWLKKTFTDIWNGIKTFFTDIWNDAKKIWTNFWTDISNILSGAWKSVSGFFTNTIKPAFKQLWQDLVDAAKSVWDTIQKVFGEPVYIVLKIIDKFDSLVNDVTSVVGIKALPTGLENSIPAAWHFSQGGGIGGYGGGDKVHAMLEPGEFVVRKEAVAALGLDSMEAINKAPKFSFGSFVKGLGNDLVHPSRIVKQVEGLLRAGAADTLDASYKVFVEPFLSGLSHFGGGMAKGLADHIEKEISDWVRGKESKTAAASGGGTGAAGSLGGSVSSPANEALADRMMAAAGYTAAGIAKVNAIWTQESGFNQFAQNPSGGPYNAAYGIPQSDPGSKMAAFGADWLTNPATQIAWGINYINSAYGGPDGAYATKVRTGVYDQGGYLKPGWTLAYNGTNQPEKVSTAAQSAHSGGSLIENVYVNERSDVDMLMNTLAFHAKAGRA